MFLLNESLRLFRESYVKSIHAFDGRNLLISSLVIFPVLIRFNIDIDVVGREGRTYMSFNVVDQVGCPGLVLVSHVNLCRDEDVRRTQMDGLDVDEPVDFRPVERAFESGQVFLRDTLADEQTVELARKEKCRRTEQYADQHARQCIVERIACEMAQERACQSYQQTDDGAAVFGEDDEDFAVTALS